MSKEKPWKKLTEKEFYENFVSSSLSGYITATYAKLIEMFGEPTCDGDAYKVDAEWVIQFKNGNIMTIYNYKNGKNYDEEDGLDVEDITDWHIGTAEDVPSYMRLVLRELKFRKDY